MKKILALFILTTYFLCGCGCASGPTAEEIELALDFDTYENYSFVMVNTSEINDFTDTYIDKFEQDKDSRHIVSTYESSNQEKQTTFERYQFSWYDDMYNVTLSKNKWGGAVTAVKKLENTKLSIVTNLIGDTSEFEYIDGYMCLKQEYVNSRFTTLINNLTAAPNIDLDNFSISSCTYRFNVLLEKIEKLEVTIQGLSGPALKSFTISVNVDFVNVNETTVVVPDEVKAKAGI